MKNELAVLKSIRHCKLIAKKLDEESKNLALSSFCAVNVPHGTYGQMQAVCALVNKRDLTERYRQTVVDAIASMPRGYRALLLTVYVKKTSKTELCQKFHVSLATLYRKLDAARKLFADNLQGFGANEPWFTSVNAALAVFHAALQKQTFDAAFDAYCDALDV